MRYVRFDPADGRVLQWIDTDLMTFDLSNPDTLHPCSGVDWTFNNGQAAMVKNGRVETYVPPPLPDAVIRARGKIKLREEREKRLESGFSYTFPDARGTHTFGTTPSDMKGWEEVTKAAQALIFGGQGSTKITLVTETGTVEVTAQEWQSILIHAFIERQKVWQGYFTLKNLPDVPDDYTKNSYWS